MTWTWTETKEAQYKALSAEICPNDSFGNPRPHTEVSHGLVAVAHRSWRNLFRKRRYWRCWFCDLYVEVQE